MDHPIALLSTRTVLGKKGKKEGRGGSCKQSEGHRGLSTRQGEEGRVDGDDDGELLLVVRGHWTA